MIEVENLTKRYGRQTAVDGVSFRVHKGEILGFLGPNGAGKTTTLRILTCYLPPTEGTARVAGYDVFEQPLEVKRRVGYVPETPPLYPDMDVQSFLDFCAKIKGVPGKDRKSRIAEAVEKTRIGDVRTTIIGKLSKGYRQRVGLAQAILHNPDVLILDEPTAGLDPKQIIETRKLIHDLSGEHTIILSTHILPEVSTTCQLVIIINQGKLEAIDTPENLTARLRGHETIFVEVEGPADEVAAKLQALSGVNRVVRKDGQTGRTSWEIETTKDTHIRSDLASAVVNSGWGLHELRPVGLSLEEIFLKLTTSDKAAEAVAEKAAEKKATGGAS